MGVWCFFAALGLTALQYLEISLLCAIIGCGADIASIYAANSGHSIFAGILKAIGLAGKIAAFSAASAAISTRSNPLDSKSRSGRSSAGSRGSSSTKKTLYRGDRSSVRPKDVFESGFESKGVHGDPLLHTKSNTTAGNFVSTSADKGIATEFAGKNGYVFEMRTNNCIDINGTYGEKILYPEQMEFVVPGGIKPSEIVGAYRVQNGKIVGDMIPNPNFGGN